MRTGRSSSRPGGRARGTRWAPFSPDSAIARARLRPTGVRCSSSRRRRGPASISTGSMIRRRRQPATASQASRPASDMAALPEDIVPAAIRADHTAGGWSLARSGRPAGAEDAPFRRRAHRSGAGLPAGAPILGHRAGDADAQIASARRHWRRHDGWRTVVPFPDHRRGPHARPAVPREQPLRRCRARTAGALSPLYAVVQGARAEDGLSRAGA